MRKRKLLTAIISLAAIFVTILSQDVLSYYAVLGESVNVVTTGDVNIRIVERMGNNETQGKGFYITPGKIISKKLSVQNTGKNPCWLRIKLTNGIDDAVLSADVYELDINEKNWIVGDDGFYYYKSVLQPEAETEYLFTQIKISGSADSKYVGKNVRMTVNAYAVQSEYMQADSPLDVVGWPEETQESNG